MVVCIVGDIDILQNSGYPSGLVIRFESDGFGAVGHGELVLSRRCNCGGRQGQGTLATIIKEEAIQFDSHPPPNPRINSRQRAFFHRGFLEEGRELAAESVVGTSAVAGGQLFFFIVTGRRQNRKVHLLRPHRGMWQARNRVHPGHLTRAGVVEVGVARARVHVRIPIQR